MQSKQIPAGVYIFMPSEEASRMPDGIRKPWTCMTGRSAHRYSSGTKVRERTIYLYLPINPSNSNNAELDPKKIEAARQHHLVSIKF
jgi:hypothetical protein